MEPLLFRTRFFGALRVALKATVLVMALLAFFYWRGHDHEAKKAAHSEAATGAAGPVDLANTIPFDAERLRAALAAETKPAILFIYTSWCPYCHKDFPLVNEAARSRRSDFAFYFVSVDTDRGKFSDFIRGQKEINFTPYIVSGQSDQRELSQSLKARGVHFTGGFPFFAAFLIGKPISEAQGALEKADFDSMLADIKAEAERQRLGSAQQETRLERP